MLLPPKPSPAEGRERSERAGCRLLSGGASPDILLLQTSDGVLQVGAEAWGMVSGSVLDDA